jgi:hypothetical protein
LYHLAKEAFALGAYARFIMISCAIAAVGSTRSQDSSASLPKGNSGVASTAIFSQLLNTNMWVNDHVLKITIGEV